MKERLELESVERAFDKGRDDNRYDGMHEVSPDVAYRRLVFVNIVCIGLPSKPGWVLIDAGLPRMAGRILRSVEERFGKDSAPAAILLTHGHFDHVGSLPSLLNKWDVPVFAHPLELPYLNGTAKYPRPDPSVGGGFLARISQFYPRGPIDLGSRLSPLPSDGTVPFLPDWRWIHTSGHSPGHTAFWREADRTLICGDAIVTTAQESAYAALTQRPELHGPPMYYTQDWDAAADSVCRLAKLEPEILVTGHGQAMKGEGLRERLHKLAREFDRFAVPKAGKYFLSPAKAEDGTAYK